ncbi:unnamed protein product [Chrysoparadoxa australica]
MAIAAMANATHFEKKELLALQKQFFELAKREGSPYTITRHEFREALGCAGIVESDVEILERLFTMFDKSGSDTITYSEMVVGLAPLCHGSLADKLNFSFELYDVDGKGQVTPEEMVAVLASMNETASYFGDSVVKKDEIKTLVADIFKEADCSETGTLSYCEYMNAVAAHPILVQFITGGGTVGQRERCFNLCLLKSILLTLPLSHGSHMWQYTGLAELLPLVFQQLVLTACPSLLRFAPFQVQYGSVDG